MYSSLSTKSFLPSCIPDNFSERLPSELNLKLDSRCETAETVTLSEGTVPESGDKYK